ncbi:MAG: TIGR03016 family PEP-CTERM system-associated outer membrane protein [Burkholderiaceae bacterium]
MLLLLLAGTRATFAQEGGEGRTPVWQLGASATLSATDNAQASPINPQSGIGTEIELDAHVNLPYRRLRGMADLSLYGMASHSDGTTYRRSGDLRAGFNAELIESHAFLDLAATYGMQLGSVFNSPERSLLIDNDNRLYTANITVSPVLRWRLGEGGRAEARLTDSTTKVKGSDVGDVHSQAGSLLLDSGVRARSATWKGQAFGAIYDPDEGRRTTEALVRGDAGWAFDAETVVSLVAGREGNDFDSSRRIYNTLYGMSLDYRPNERTRFYAEALQRFFGTGHTALLSYRLPQFALLAASSRTNSRPGLGLEDPNAFHYGSAYDVLFLQLASVEPDVDRRRVLVIDLLRTNGIDPTQAVNPQLTTSGVLLVENHSVSATWAGVRNTITIALSGGSSRRLDSLVSLPVSDQFIAEERIDQVGVQLLWFRRLTPSDDLSAFVGWNRAEGSVTQRRATSQGGQLLWSRKVGTRSTFSTRLSHQRFEELTTASSYSMNIVACEYRVRF